MLNPDILVCDIALPVRKCMLFVANEAV